MHDIPVCSTLLKDQHRIFPIVHETGAPIDPMTEIIEQLAQAAGKAPLDICQRDSVPAVGYPLGDPQF